jgi:hypothetical protein
MIIARGEWVNASFQDEVVMMSDGTGGVKWLKDKK